MTMSAIERRNALYNDRSALLERMVEIRTLEDRIQRLFADGLVHGTTHTCQGQEAVAVGIAAAARIDDQVTCTYRGHGHALALGLSPLSVVGEVMGRVVGSVGGLGGSMHLCEPTVGLLPTFAIVGAGIPVAAGAALTAQVTGTDQAAIAIFGDGASNIGAFHESLNLASIWGLPAVFACENNVYGEYSRINLTTPIEDIATRAQSYGIPGLVVNGQEVETVRNAMASALDRAREGGGPTLLEMKTYRYAGHSRADTAPYRPEGEFDDWYTRDPINTFASHLIEAGELTEHDVENIQQRVTDRIEEAVEEAMASPTPKPDAMFKHVWAN